MNLYHYTHPGTVFQILLEGLKPNASDQNAFMTGNVPVVWLTSQESNTVTAADVAFMESRSPLDRKVGDCLFGGTARLTVHLERHNKRLVRYADFLRKNGADMAAIKNILMPSALSAWWVYSGEIPPNKIDMTLPARIMLEALDHHIVSHPDAEARERFKTMREQVVSLAPDFPVSVSLP